MDNTQVPTMDQDSALSNQAPGPPQPPAPRDAPPRDTARVISGLREYYNSSPTAREILDYLAEAGQDKRVMSVKRLERRLSRRGSMLDREDIVPFFQRLHAIGLGEILAGEDARRPRFLWSYPSAQLARVATGEAWELEPLPEILPDELVLDENGDHGPHAESLDSEGRHAAGAHAEGQDAEGRHGEGAYAGDLHPEDPHAGSPNGKGLKHVFRLREDFTVKFRLPADLTAGEAFRLADYIKTLPFGI